MRTKTFLTWIILAALFGAASYFGLNYLYQEMAQAFEALP